MPDWFYPTAFSSWGREERAAIDRVIRSGRFTMGEEVAAFEREFANWHGRRYGVMANSGSSANLVAVAALFQKQDRPLRRGDKVIVPALAWSTTYAPLVQHGLELILADCDETWNANDPPPSVDEASLVVCCSILGNPARMLGWQEAASRRCPIIEDNCESLGAGKYGRLCGTFGTMSTSSFFYSHQISAIEGGMILTDDYELAMLCRVLRAHGWTRDIDPAQSFDEEYKFAAFGYNVRPLEMHAAIAREQLKKQDAFKWARVKNLEHFVAATASLPIQQQLYVGEPNPFGLAFLVKDSETRARLAAALRENSIDCRLPTGGSFRLHPYGKPWRDQQTPRADDIHRRGMFLGNAPFDISDKIERAVGVMRKVLT